MKVTVLQENLARGLSIVARAVSSRSTLPVLANILVATDEGRLRLSATNLELGITCWIGAKIEEEGSTTVPARTFNDLVSTLSDKQVNLSLAVRTQTLNIRCGASNTDIKCIDAQEFPPMPMADLSQGLQLKVTELKEMIQQVAFAASSATDEARPVLTGVLVNVKGNKLVMAAADGFRLSVRKAELASPAARSINAIIPARALVELARIATDGDRLVTMAMPSGRGQVVFRMDDIELVAQLIEGTFPDYEQIVPRRYDTKAVFSTSACAKATRQAEIFAREGSRIARLNIQPGSIEIVGQSEETGYNQSTIDANVEGPALTIAFNVTFLREVMDVIKTPNVVLETTTNTSPGVIRPVGGQPNEGEFFHVIMPMHMNS